MVPKTCYRFKKIFVNAPAKKLNGESAVGGDALYCAKSGTRCSIGPGVANLNVGDIA